MKRFMLSVVLITASLLATGVMASADEQSWQGRAARRGFPPSAGVNGRLYDVQIFANDGQPIFALTIVASSDMSAYARGLRIMRWVGGSWLSITRQQQ